MWTPCQPQSPSTMSTSPNPMTAHRAMMHRPGPSCYCKHYKYCARIAATQIGTTKGGREYVWGKPCYVSGARQPASHLQMQAMRQAGLQPLYGKQSPGALLLGALPRKI